jgi:translation initiation factor 2D
VARLPLLVRKDDLLKALLKKLSPYFAIVGPTGQCQISSGQLPSVTVTVETRMGNKVVTHIRGLEVFGVDLQAFTKDCQKRFACAASTGLVPGMVKDREVVVQGHLSSELEGLLVEGCGVPKHLIEVKVGKGVKPKKR